MRFNQLTLTLALLAGGCSSCQPTATSAPSSTVEIAAEPAATELPLLEPAAPATARPAPSQHGLDVGLVVQRRAYDIPVELNDPVTLAKLRALWHPSVADYVPGGVSPFDAMYRAYASRRGGSPIDAPPSPADAADIQRRLPGLQARQLAAAQAQADYRASFGDQPRSLLLPPPRVALGLRIRNSSGRPLHIRVSGDATTLRMQLDGPGVIAALGGGDQTERYECGRWLRLEPGAHHDLAIARLEYGDRAKRLGLYWTEPGRYQLRVGFDTTVSDAASPEVCGGGEPVSLVAEPVELIVRAAVTR